MDMEEKRLGVGETVSLLSADHGSLTRAAVDVYRLHRSSSAHLRGTSRTGITRRLRRHLTASAWFGPFRDRLGATDPKGSAMLTLIKYEGTAVHEVFAEQ